MNMYGIYMKSESVINYVEKYIWYRGKMIFVQCTLDQMQLEPNFNVTSKGSTNT